eukprot:TRINITY_DN68130_c0_g1_i1.p1 TRINITY_DN68130_c0_g1~~TRINITY_DN68130_c0_g1_i1.p1  ORF type:complete len:285 (-),score=27.46 TRINITY_DN68130_c0_g1_i1:130-984(-)
MGIAPSSSLPPADSNNVLIHSFQLDPKADLCMLPILCPGKQAMFPVPQNFSSHLSNFISYEEGIKILGEINKILLETAFPTKPWNPFALICALIMFLIVWGGTSGAGLFFIVLNFLPLIIYFGVLYYFKYFRKERLLNCLNEWNSAKSNGVFLSLGGCGEVRGISVGSIGGGIYENFYMSTFSPMINGYLHVFVNYLERSAWCQRNGIPFVAPVAPAQQTMEQQIAPQGQFPVPPGPQVYQIPVVPSGFQVPAGYALVLQSQVPQLPVQQQQDLPPSYEESEKY